MCSRLLSAVPRRIAVHSFGIFILVLFPQESTVLHPNSQGRNSPTVQEKQDDSSEIAKSTRPHSEPSLHAIPRKAKYFSEAMLKSITKFKAQSMFMMIS